MITEFLTLQNQLRVFHWQTTSYAQHEAFGKTYQTLDVLIDEYIEVFAGKYGRPKLDGMTVSLQDIGEDSINNSIDTMLQYLQNGLLKNLEETDTDLLNIRDEMVAALNKLKYLLTLK